MSRECEYDLDRILSAQTQFRTSHLFRAKSQLSLFQFQTTTRLSYTLPETPSGNGSGTRNVKLF